ncbi:MAG: copper oxidase [Sphingomonas sp. 66-10]|nr:MAG: copper oxidase [Sphingomonas sp. 66-10]
MTMSSQVPWLDSVLVAWFVLTALSVAYVAWDAFTRNPELKVMKWGWLLVTLYGGPIMAAAYVLSCQEPANERHEDFVRPLWKQAFGSAIHCMAGDATGVIAAAAITTALGLPMWQDVVAEYAFGFAFGLLIFQALFMRDMAGGSYRGALRMSFIPEWLSMNAVMAGMIPTMVVLMSRDMAAMHASSLRFWGVMSLATLVGFAVAYPINLWLVGVRLKHGMGTVRVLGHGGHEVAADRRSVTEMPGMEHDAMQGMSGMASGSRATPPQIAAMAMLTLVMLGAGVVVATLFGRWAM